MKILRIGFLASGNGSNMQAIIRACKKGKLSALPCVVISNNPKAFALERAKKESIPAYVLNLDAAIVQTLKEFRVDIVVLVGYLQLLGKKTTSFYKNRILNIHPSLLPKFGGKGMYGQHVHKAVIAKREKWSGATVHVVDDLFDHGKILAQKKVRVLSTDTPESLAKKVLRKEHTLFVEVLQKISSGEIDLPR